MILFSALSLSSTGPSFRGITDVHESRIKADNAVINLIRRGVLCAVFIFTGFSTDESFAKIQQGYRYRSICYYAGKGNVKHYTMYDCIGEIKYFQREYRETPLYRFLKIKYS